MVHHPASAFAEPTADKSNIRNSGFPPSFRPRSESELRRASRSPSFVPPSKRVGTTAGKQVSGLPSPNSGLRSSVSQLRSQVSGLRFPLSRFPVSGFTLVELLTVVAIIAVLAGLILGVSGYATRKADKSRAIADMEKIKGALEEYRLQYGEYPSMTGSLTSIDAPFPVERNKLTNTMQNASPDLNFTDPWGNGYHYSKVSKFVYTLSSWGPDSTDTNDNITDGLAGQ